MTDGPVPFNEEFNGPGPNDENPDGPVFRGDDPAPNDAKGPAMNDPRICCMSLSICILLHKLSGLTFRRVPSSLAFTKLCLQLLDSGSPYLGSLLPEQKCEPKEMSN